MYARIYYGVMIHVLFTVKHILHQLKYWKHRLSENKTIKNVK